MEGDSIDNEELDIDEGSRSQDENLFQFKPKDMIISEKPLYQEMVEQNDYFMQLQNDGNQFNPYQQYYNMQDQS